jgi:DNA mismatch endonuclease, patch repair protein
MDRLTPQQRHKNMAAVRSKDTKPEVLVRKFLWSRGFRYRLNNPRLPGHPDIVLRKYKTCIFVNGCFWHGHKGCKYFRLPKTNTEFWQKKIERNKERDKEEQVKLAQMGWHCITVWECELKADKREKTLESLAFTINHIFLQDHTVTYKKIEEEGTVEMAAEPTNETH